MGFNRFSVLLSIRLVVIMLALAVLAYLFTTPGYYAATLLLLLVTLGLTWEIFRFVSRTNQEVSRFLDASKYADFGQRFDLGPVGAPMCCALSGIEPHQTIRLETASHEQNGI
jgi:two-component system nitrogen regulation sensor histidine kinase NtrY